MKKIFILAIIGAMVILLSNCSASKKASTSGKMTYNADMYLLIEQNCSPCHIPARGGNKEAFDNYTAVKTDIDAMIKRIELQPADRGFMPFKGKKLNDSTINAFKQWRADGVLEN